MSHRLRAFRKMMALASVTLAADLMAQAPSPSTRPTDTTAVEVAGSTQTPAADAAPARPKRDRVMSDEVAATLASGMPKYNPPPKIVEPKPEEEQADLRETDKPRNKIIRLPKYVVKEPKPPVFRDRDLRSKNGLTDLGLKRNPGLGIGNFGGLNRPVGLLMYEEKERLDTIAELKNDAKDAKNSGDNAAGDYILRENNRANYRPTDFGWNSDGGGK